MLCRQCNQNLLCARIFSELLPNVRHGQFRARELGMSNAIDSKAAGSFSGFP